MKISKITKFSVSGLTLLLAVLSGFSEIWVSAYYTGWNQPNYPPQSIDFDAVTHIIHFSALPNNDGSLDWSSHGITPEHSQALISAAHQASVPVILCVGGYGVIDRFRSATSDANRANFVSSMINLMQERGYDGIDMDWEPLEASDHVNYEKLINELRAAMNGVSANCLLTAATIKSGLLMSRIADKFDQINIMTYDISRPYQGWLTWHNAPVYNGGNVFQSTGALLPCCDLWVDEFTDSGVPIEKLGIGLPFYGFIWTGGSGTETGGVTAPLQQYTTDPACDGNLPYSVIMNTWYTPERYNWDEDAQVPYLSIDNNGSEQDVFISYDNEESTKCKVRFARTKGIGGIIIFELQQGVHNGTSPMLTAIKEAKEETGLKYTQDISAVRKSLSKSVFFRNRQFYIRSSCNLSKTRAEIFSLDGKKILSSTLIRDISGVDIYRIKESKTISVPGCYMAVLNTAGIPQIEHLPFVVSDYMITN